MHSVSIYRASGLVLATLCLVSAPLTAAPKVDYARDIQPILSENCYLCHGPDAGTRKAKLRLDTKEGAFRVQDDVAILVPGKSGDSELFQRLITSDDDEVMPPPKSKKKMSPAQIDLIKRWIDEGAAWGGHWSFTAPQRPALPTVKNAGWSRNGIDRFVLAKLEKEGLAPSPQASPHTLIRRVTLDLTGLPPTPAEVDAFVKEWEADLIAKVKREPGSPDAYDRLVDRLLTSPRFGERMAWDWLEAARYADSNGYQGDNERTMWPWRDWVVQAFNRNMPYDQFTVLQLAGDWVEEGTEGRRDEGTKGQRDEGTKGQGNNPQSEIRNPKSTSHWLPTSPDERRLATAFNRNHPINGEGGRIAEENRIEYLFDQSETMGTVWMGVTLNCCRCHDHKYDPFSRKDYYSFIAFFNQTPVDGGGGNPQTPPVIEVVSGEQKQRLAETEARIAALNAELAKRLKEIAPDLALREKDAIAALEKNGNWRSLKPSSYKAVTQTLTLHEADIIHAGGPNPKNDTYTITAPTDLDSITGLRLEALRHPAMTQGGLARSDSGNFVLTEIEVQIKRAGDDKPARLKIASAEATFEQGDLKVARAFDGNAGTGWAVWDGKPVNRDHEAVFRFAEPVKSAKGATLTITLRHDSPHASHNLGHFRLSVTDAPQPKLGGASQALLAALRTPAEKRNKAQADLVSDHLRVNDAVTARLRGEIDAATKSLADLRKGGVKVMVMEDRKDPKQFRKTFMLDKGIYNKPQEEVTAGLPAWLAPTAAMGASDAAPGNAAAAPMNRLTLARWLVSPGHPLTARVTVNRLWQQFFGIGLVKTSEDFGIQGERPMQQDLLDWLAVEFAGGRDGGTEGRRDEGADQSAIRNPKSEISSPWDVKRLVKLIVTSATYRQNSAVTPALAERDPENRLLARGARFRMPSWMIRDQALAVGGLLVDKSGEPGGRPVNGYQPPGVWEEATFGGKRYTQDKGEALYRRSLYTFWRRIVGPTMFFDTAPRSVCTVKAIRTNSPLHALTTFNDTTYVEAARAMAQRVLTDNHAAGDGARIDFAYRLALSRSSSTEEKQVLLAALERLRKQFAGDRDAAMKLVKVGESPRDEKLDAVEHAAWASLCLAICNLDESLTKE